MKCRNCGHEPLLAVVSFKKTFELAKRGGSIKVGGQTISQVDMKLIWDKDPTGKDQPIKGPIFCPECETEHFYLEGAKTNPHIGSVLDARAKGLTALLEET